jgi:hypothetical protein
MVVIGAPPSAEHRHLPAALKRTCRCPVFTVSAGQAAAV